MLQQLHTEIAPGLSAADTYELSAPERPLNFGNEAHRIRAAISFMADHCAPPAVLSFITTNKPTSSRALIGDLAKWITAMQRRHSVPQHVMQVFEMRSGLHGHLVAPCNADMERRLRGSAKFAGIEVRPVTNAAGLAGYLSKEIGHHVAGGGDHCRLSRQLERDAVEAGAIEPHRHRNAHRSTAPRQPRRSKSATGSGIGIADALDAVLFATLVGTLPIAATSHAAHQATPVMVGTAPPTLH
jgi:hypothetical protein